MLEVSHSLLPEPHLSSALFCRSCAGEQRRDARSRRVNRMLLLLQRTCWLAAEPWPRHKGCRDQLDGKEKSRCHRRHHLQGVSAIQIEEQDFGATPYMYTSRALVRSPSFVPSWWSPLGVGSQSFPPSRRATCCGARHSPCWLPCAAPLSQGVACARPRSLLPPRSPRPLGASAPFSSRA